MSIISIIYKLLVIISTNQAIHSYIQRHLFTVYSLPYLQRLSPFRESNVERNLLILLVTTSWKSSHGCCTSVYLTFSGTRDIKWLQRGSPLLQALKQNKTTDRNKTFTNLPLAGGRKKTHQRQLFPMVVFASPLLPPFWDCVATTLSQPPGPTNHCHPASVVLQTLLLVPPVSSVVGQQLVPWVESQRPRGAQV